MTVVWIVLGVVAVIVLWAVVTYNGLVARRNRVDESWSGIDVQLKRRHDLIPNLLETVKGYAAHERQTLENVVKARNSAVAAQDSGDPAAAGQAEGVLSGALRQVFALGEAYPDLKANTNFLDLQAQLADTEDKISAARRIYNANVRDYNTKIQQVPSNVIAGIGKFTARQFFELEDPAVERAVPTVSFS
ncbi:MAG: LemA family protein [Thermoleophilia bacterium]|nr:LemA family protein [Thermoleophilia bacterium]